MEKLMEFCLDGMTVEVRIGHSADAAYEVWYAVPGENNWLIEDFASAEEALDQLTNLV